MGNIEKVASGHWADKAHHFLIVPVWIHFAPSCHSGIRLARSERFLLGKHILTFEGGNQQMIFRIWRQGTQHYLILIAMLLDFLDEHAIKIYIMCQVFIELHFGTVFINRHHGR